MNTKNKISLLIISACQLFSLSAFAQTANVQKKISDNTLTGPIVVPSGGSITIGAGATITNNGTATGFTSSLAVGTSAITGGTSGYLLYNNAGTLGNLATAVGGANTADSGKVPVFSSNGNLRAYFYRAVASDTTQYTDYYPSGYFSAVNHLGGGFTLSVARLSAVTADRVLQWPDASGFLVSTGDIGTVSNTMLANSAITIGGASTSLGATVTATTILDSVGSTQGSILYRSGSAWVPLAPGTSGQFLKTQGASANPTWASATGKVLQVVWVTPKTDTASGTNTTFNNSVYSGSITVQSTTSRVVCVISGSASCTTGGYSFYARATGAGTALQVGDAASSRIQCFTSGAQNAINGMVPFTMVGSDAPGATGARSYVLQISTDSGGTWYLNRSPADGTSNQRGATTMMLVEYEP